MRIRASQRLLPRFRLTPLKAEVPDVGAVLVTPSSSGAEPLLSGSLPVAQTKLMVRDAEVPADRV